MPIKVSEEQWPSIGTPVTSKKVDKVWGPSRGGRVSVNEKPNSTIVAVSGAKRGKSPSNPRGELGSVAHNNATTSASVTDTPPTTTTAAPPVKEKMVFGSIDPNTVFRSSSGSTPKPSLLTSPSQLAPGASEITSKNKKSKSKSKKNKKKDDNTTHTDSSTPIVASSSRLTFSIGVEAEPAVRRHRLQSQPRATSRPPQKSLTQPSSPSISQRWKFGTASRSRSNTPPPKPTSEPETSPDDAAPADQHVYPYPQVSTATTSTSSSSSSSTIFDPRASAFVSSTSSSSTTPPQPSPLPLPSYPISYQSSSAPFALPASRAYANPHPDPELEVKDYGRTRGYPIPVPGPQHTESIPPPHLPSPSVSIDDPNVMYGSGRGRRGGGRGYGNGGESRPRRGRRGGGLDGGYRGYGGGQRGGGHRPPPGPPPFTVVPPPQTRLPLPLPVPLPLIPHMAHPGPTSPPVPAPLSNVPFPLDPTRYWLLGQVEYYMSPQNMAQDFFLKQQMDARGWIPIALIASFNRVKTLIPPPADEEAQQRLVREVLMLSTLVQVRGGMVRMGGWERYVLPDAKPSEVDESTPEPMYGNGYPLPIPPYGYPGYQHGYLSPPGAEGYWDGQHRYQHHQQHVYHPENGFLDLQNSGVAHHSLDVYTPRVGDGEQRRKEGDNNSDTKDAAVISVAPVNTVGEAVSPAKSHGLVENHVHPSEPGEISIPEGVQEQSNGPTAENVQEANDADEDEVEEEESDEEVVFVLGSENHVVSWSTPTNNSSQRQSTKT